MGFNSFYQFIAWLWFGFDSQSEEVKVAHFKIEEDEKWIGILKQHKNAWKF